MYLNFYKLKKEPFNITPNPELLYLSPSHKEALAAAIYGVTQRKGFVAIIGEVGVGKTTIIRSFLENMNKQELKIIYLFNSNISFKALLKTIYQNLGLAPETDDIFEMVNHLHRVLIDLYKAGENVVLIIDEAQNMPVETLRNLHMLSNLETSTDKLIQVIFCGQPELDEKLNRDLLRQLKQRIVIRVNILPLTKKHSLAYIAHRLSKTAQGDPALFTDRALHLIVNKAAGIPRVINTLCDNCLITSFGKQQKKVPAKVAREIIAERRETPGFHLGWRTILTTGLVAATIAFVALSGDMRLFTGKNPAISAAPTPAAINYQPSPKENAPAIASLPPDAGEDTSGGNRSAVKVVKRGDTLARLILDNYGSIDRRLIELVKRTNPGITNENVIQEGSRIYFPVEK